METVSCQKSSPEDIVGFQDQLSNPEGYDDMSGARVLHGRKASTFLGIFDDTPPLDTKQAKPPTQANVADTEEKKRKKKKRDKELGLMVDTDDELEAKVRIIGLSADAEKHLDLELYNKEGTSEVVAGESVKKPISSATYFPHKLKDDQGSASQVNTQKSVVSSDSENSATNIKLLGLEGTVSEDSEDDNNVLSSDETQEFPLKVKLQPFTDKVGGHTAIFRFSERAVCKALVNRENNWYETVELRHSGLLHFMPRYIGVLNVRQYFTSKEEFMNQIPYNKGKSSATVRMDTSDDQILCYGDNPGEILNPKLFEPLEQTVSLPNVEQPSLSEVCLDDNKHIIPDSLWSRYSHSPSSLPPNIESIPFTKSSCDRCSESKNSTDNHHADVPSQPTGYTLVNTRLKELIIEEVFGHASVPIKPSNLHNYGRTQLNQLGQHSRHSSITTGDDKMRVQSSDFLASYPISKQLRSSSTSSSRGRYFPHKEPNDSRDFLVYLREIKQDIGGVQGTDLFDIRNNSSLMLSVPNSPKSKLEQTAHESISYEEQSHTVVSKFILLEDLTRKLNKPCVLDLKMGTRQYGVDAKRSKQLSQREKSINTTSRKLGVRICGLKIWNKNYYITRDKYFGRRVKIGWQFVRVLARFLYDGVSNRSIVRQIPSLTRQLDTLYNEAVKLKSYRMYGASLLLMYDAETTSNKWSKVKINLIDFARCVTKNDIETSMETFKIRPKNPDLEDRGFLRGLKSLRFYLLIIWNHLTSDHALIHDDDELIRYLDSVPEFQAPWDWVDEFDKEKESRFNNPYDELRKKWRKYELIFDVEPVYGDDEVSD